MRIASVLLLALSCSVFAQSPANVQRGPDNGPNTFIPGVDVLPLPGMPFTGNDKIVWTRPIEGGGSITAYLESKAVRDGQGRVYRERHGFGPATADPAVTLQDFYILDPVSGTRTVCSKPLRMCHIVPFQPQPGTRLQPVGPFNQGKEYLSRETLGDKWIDNLPVTGTLEKVTISPGAMGNDQILTLSREFWYSPDLKTNVSVLRKDPRTGTQDIRLQINSRGEPDPAIFKVPAGYRIEDNRPAGSPPLPRN